MHLTVPYMLWSAPRRAALSEAIARKKRYVVGIGLAASGCYLMVLYAFRMADNAPFVVVLRQSSIAFATVLGVVLLKEDITLPKLLGVLLISAGVVLLDYADG
jgi:uncharacterized membrane protein